MDSFEVLPTLSEYQNILYVSNEEKGTISSQNNTEISRIQYKSQPNPRIDNRSLTEVRCNKQ